MWIGAIIVIAVLLLIGVGYVAGRAHAAPLFEGERAELMRRNDRNRAMLEQKIQYLERQVIALHGPADWEQRFTKELERERIRNGHEIEQ